MKTILILLCTIAYVNTSFSQDYLGEPSDTLTLDILPKEFQSKIESKLDLLLVKDEITGKFKVKDDYCTYWYEYRIFIENDVILGSYRRIAICDKSDIENNGDAYTFTVVRLYCCKDKKHSPNENAKTKKEILDIQEKNGCKKIGFCTY